MSQGLPFERGMRARRARRTSGELTQKLVRTGVPITPTLASREPVRQVAADRTGNHKRIQITEKVRLRLPALRAPKPFGLGQAVALAHLRYHVPPSQIARTAASDALNV